MSLSLVADFTIDRIKHAIMLPLQSGAVSVFTDDQYRTAHSTLQCDHSSPLLLSQQTASESALVMLPTSRNTNMPNTKPICWAPHQVASPKIGIFHHVIVTMIPPVHKSNCVLCVCEILYGYRLSRHSPFPNLKCQAFMIGGML